MPTYHSADDIRYAEQLAQGCLKLEILICFRLDCPGGGKEETLILSTTIVERTLIVLEGDEEVGYMLVEKTIRIVLVRCRACKGRFRLLPSNVHAYRHYALEVITLALLLYAQGHRSLRAVVGKLYFKGDDPDEPNDREVDHSLLHRWTEAMGSHVLGRPCSRPHGESINYFLAKAIALDNSRVRVAMEVAIEVNPRRYRTEPRCERLAAMAWGLNVTATLANVEPADPTSLVECRSLILSLAGRCTLGFTNRTSLCTSLQHRSSKSVEESRAVLLTPTERTRDSCKTRTRSPPGDSSR